jgi:tRNA (adenine22-N1)-methyltransferase
MSVSLSPRLNEVYRRLGGCDCLADVGCDHGKLPVKALQEGICDRAIATDISGASLTKAAYLADRCGVELDCRVGDGLKPLVPHEADVVVIAGMGGDTICGILDRAEWLFSGTYRLVLQPMTHAEVLRFWLVHNAFQITREAVIAEGEHVYQMFCASPGKDRAYTDAEYLTGNRACVSLGDDRRLLLQHERARLRKKTAGMQKAGQEDSPAFRFYKNILLELEDLENNADR